MRLERASAYSAGPLWYDVTTNGNNGTPSDPSILVDFDFDGVVDFVDTLLVGSPQNPAQPWTISMWCVRESTATGNVGIMGTRSGNTGWELRDMNAGALDQLDIDFFPFLRTNNVIPAYNDDKWHMISLTWTPGTPGTLQGYGDGVVHLSTTIASDYAASVLPFVFGKSPTVFWDGKIDTVRVYPRVLSADEIARDYAAGMAAHQ
ncbi:MAG: putative concanavalin A-like lectin/glucanases superfamily protein [Prokaryotic dsDNA virus sp.]|nr:MAG: putative concanavalin A-like lectin/glucanases superfamily protein [Prokaryotic dsDNA virus sp.]